MKKIEKVLKDLGTLIDYWDDVDRLEEHVYGANILNTLTDARTWIEDTLKEQEAQGWISVKDRLPENNRFMLVCNDDGHMMVAQYIEETAQWQYKYTNYDVDVWDDEEQGPVCWWAELPEPPKEET